MRAEELEEADCEINALEMRSYIDSVLEVVQSSTWSKRAWTFLEGALSRRRLCFHEEGIFVLCREAIIHDLLDFDSYKDNPAPTLDTNLPYFDLDFDKTAHLCEISSYTQKSQHLTITES